MPSKKTIQDIKLPDRSALATKEIAAKPKRALSAKKGTAETVATKPVVRRPRPVSQKPRVRVIGRSPVVDRAEPAFIAKKKNGGYWWLLGIVLVLVIGGYAYGAYFSSASVIISPKEIAGSQNQSVVTLAQEPNQTEVPLVVMSLSDTITDTVMSSGSEDAAERSSGTIMIYNAFSTAPQKLTEETRFEAANGKIYKTGKGTQTTIPGMQGTTPGQVEVTVYAAEAGQDYNQDLTDFTVPGFKGTAKYEKFYARSVTPMAGGFAGTRAAISAEDRSVIAGELSQKLGDRLRAEALLQKTDDFIILDESARVQIGEAVVESVPDNSLQAKVSVPGSYSAILVNKSELARALARQMVPGYANEPVMINNLDALQIAVTGTVEGLLQSADRLQISVAGNPRFVYEIDEEALKKQLLALSRKESNAVFQQYPAVQSAQVVIRPFWKMKLPGNDDDISIRYNLDGK